jgi:hypothetical protein
LFRYIFSGYETILPHFNPEVYKLNLTTMVWTLLTCSGKPPIPRDFHTATAVGDFMVVFGGRCGKLDRFSTLVLERDGIFRVGLGIKF